LKSLKELVFSEHIVDAVARIKIILEHEGLIKSAGVRRPQLGVGEAEKKQLLTSYRALKDNEFHYAKKGVQKKKRVVG
jgi:dihydrodipicolinate synthase/N-acetylneuraminate lyase